MLKLITYWIDKQLYGLPLLLAGEFYPTIEATRFDAGDPRIYGITHIRGGSAVVLDMRKVASKANFDRRRASHDDLSIDDCNFIYLQAQDHLCDEALQQNLRSYEEPTVLIVDRLAGICEINPTEGYACPAHLDAPYYEGVFRTEAGDLILLNFSKVIESILEDVKELTK